jgi:ClpP class serine protease
MAQVEQPAGDKPQPEHVLAWIREHYWAIDPHALETIVAVASREISDPEYKTLEALRTQEAATLAGTRDVELRDGGIAIVSIEGPIFRRANLFTRFSGATSIEMTAMDFSKAVASDQVNGIVLAIDSPGGEVSGINEFANLVRAATSKKPVVAYVMDFAASAAFWIASAASSIVMDATAKVGSIGVVARVRKGGDANIVEVVSAQSPNKRVDIATEPGRAQIQAHVDRIAQIFVESVAGFRGVKPEAVLTKYGQGGVLVGADAVAVGMADELGSLESVIAGISGNNQRYRQMTTQATAPAVTRELIAEQHPAIAAFFREEGKKIGHEEGAKSELVRIKGVLSKKRTGHEALVEQLAFDGKTTPDQAAAQVLDAIDASAKQKLEKIEADATALKVPASGADPAATKDPATVSQKTPEQIGARAREIVAEKASKGITISAAAAVAIAEKE